MGCILNLCMCCNEKIKFVVLLECVIEFGFDVVCIGYYVILVDGVDGFELYCVFDNVKD